MTRSIKHYFIIYPRLSNHRSQKQSVKTLRESFVRGTADFLEECTFESRGSQVYMCTRTFRVHDTVNREFVLT